MTPEYLNFRTVFTSNTPVQCHIMQGRLRSEGIDTYIYDEFMVWVDPFKAVAIGGVKLKVPEDQFEKASVILHAITHGNLVDEQGEYNIGEALAEEMGWQNQVMEVKSRIRESHCVPDKFSEFIPGHWPSSETNRILQEEQDYYFQNNKKYKFSWQQFWYELIDFDRDVFAFLHPRSVEYYLEREMVENFATNAQDVPSVMCPECGSGNVSFGQAIDYKWDIPYLILSFLLWAPFYPFRNKFHCFDCKHNFTSRILKK